MLVTKTFNVDLVRLEVPPTWACMQGDANSRAICYRLYADGLSYEIPSGVSLRIAYEKADKTSGVYSQLPDGSSAYEISGNTVTIRLIEDVSAKSGMALVQPILYDSDGNILGIWSTEIVVWRGVSKESSSTGVNYSSYENDIGTLQAKVKRLESLVDGGSTTETYGITQSCTNCSSSSNISEVNKNDSFTATYTPNSGYSSISFIVKMGGTDITTNSVRGNRVTISKVTGNVVITANGYTLSNYDVTNNLTNCTTSNNATTVEADASYTATVTQSGDYKLKALTVKMGGTDITNDVVTYSTTGDYNIRTYVSATINIPKITGNVEITGTGAMWYWMSLTTSNCSKKRTTGCIDSQHDNYAWDGDTYVQAYKPDKEYTSVGITVKRGSSDGTDVTSSVVGKTTIDGVSYDSVTINNVKDKYYIRASGTN